MRLLGVGAYGARLAILGAAIPVACKPLARGANQAQTQVEQATQALTAERESALSDAGNQRFRERREAVVRMRAALHTWAVGESAFLADSGHPGDVMPPYDATLMRGDEPALFSGPWFRGPGAWLSVHHDGVTCWVYVGADTTISQRPSGQPACAGDRAIPPRLASILRGELPQRLDTAK